jgi:hypothetical protein
MHFDWDVSVDSNHFRTICTSWDIRGQLMMTQNVLAKAMGQWWLMVIAQFTSKHLLPSIFTLGVQVYLTIMLLL